MHSLGRETDGRQLFDRMRRMRFVLALLLCYLCRHSKLWYCFRLIGSILHCNLVYVRILVKINIFLVN